MSILKMINILKGIRVPYLSYSTDKNKFASVTLHWSTQPASQSWDMIRVGGLGDYTARRFDEKPD